MLSLVSDPKEQWIQAIGEYLTIAGTCVPPSGDVRGYSATLLLLCAIDAIGNGLLSPVHRKWCRLDVLADPGGPFGLPLNKDQIDNLTHWYRNLLVHTGTMAPGSFLDPARQGAPFDFDANDALRLIRVPVLYEVVKRAWDQCDKTGFTLPPQSMAMPDISVPLPAFDPATVGYAVSGVVFPPGKP
jgi:hypothetical protein